MQPGGAAEGEQREAAWIDAAPHRDQPHPLCHRGVDDAVDAARGGEPLDPEPGGDTVDGALGGGGVELACATEEIRRIEIAEHEVGVGYSGGLAALAVAGRTRQGAGALRADM